MEQSTGGEETHSLFDDDEIQVAEILLNLETIIAESEARKHLSFTWAAEENFSWGATRRRSSRHLEPPATSSPSPSQPPLKSLRGERDKKTIHQVKVEAKSPSTPLSFSPGESDSRSKHCSQKVHKRKKKEDLLDAIGSLTARRNLLMREVENVRSYYNKLLTLNGELKAMKRQVALGFSYNKLDSSSIIYEKREEPELKLKTMSNGLTLGHRHQISGFHHQQPFTLDPVPVDAQTRGRFQNSYVQMAQPFLFSSNSVVGGANHMVAPVGIPNLSVTSDENYGVDSFQPSDYSRDADDKRARAAEARRKRMLKMKEMRCGQGVGRQPRCR